MSRNGIPLEGRRVLITGAARGIGAATARRLYERGARVALLGLEPEELQQVAEGCGGAPWRVCDVRDREQVDEAVAESVDALGGLDVVMANAGIGKQLALVGGDPEVFETTLAVNVLGVYYTLRAAGPHVSHDRGYALAIASLAAAVHPPLMGAYNASKSAVEALGNTLRVELHGSGAKVGVGYFAEIDTDMTSRGFGTEAASKMKFLDSPLNRVAPLHVAIDAIERGIARRSRRVVAPGWVAGVLPVRMLAQRVVEIGARRGLNAALEIAREEKTEFTTPQPEKAGAESAAR